MNRLLLSLLFCGVAAMMGMQAEPVVPDSMINEDGVYYYLFTEPAKSEYVMEQLRKRGSDTQGNVLSEMDLDFLEGDMYYNTARHIAAIHYYKQAMELAEKNKDSDNRFALLHRLISCYDATGMMLEKMKTAEKMHSAALEEGNKPMEAISLFEMGLSMSRRSNQADGIEKMLKANAMMENCNYRRKYDNLRYEYEGLIMELRKANRYDEALDMCARLEKIVGKIDENLKPMKNEVEIQEMTMLSQRAMLYALTGRNAEADKDYKRFTELEKNVPGRSQGIYGYLACSHRYGELLERTRTFIDKAVASGDTITMRFSANLNSMATALEGLGDYRGAVETLIRYNVIRDSLTTRGMQDQIAEFNALYEVQASQTQAELYSSRSRMYGILAILGAIVVCALIAYIVKVRRFNSFVQTKNKALARAIAELSQAQSDTRLALQQQQQTNPTSPMPTEESETTEANDNAQCAVTEQIQEDENRKMFIRIEQDIISRRLYAASLNREQLAKELGIPRAQFAALFRDYAGLSYTKYMNRLRLREAVELMRENPSLTIDAIASECGMSRQLFYMLFREEYGITPTEFRAAQRNS